MLLVLCIVNIKIISRSYKLQCKAVCSCLEDGEGHSLLTEKLRIEFQRQAWALCVELAVQDCQYWPLFQCFPDLALAEFSTDQHTTLKRPKNSLEIFYVQLLDLKACLDPKVD